MTGTRTRAIDLHDLELEAAAPVGWIIPRGGLYEPMLAFEPGAVDANLLPVEDRDGNVLDIVAWAPNQPTRWWLRTGHGAILGADSIDLGCEFGVAVDLLATPAAWQRVRASGHFWAVCIIDWTAHIESLLAEVRELVVHRAVRDRLEDTLRRQWQPPFLLREATQARHAA